MKVSEKNRRYREANREKESARKRRYYEANREKELERARRYHEANREEGLARKRRYYEANRGRRVTFSAGGIAWSRYVDNKEEVLAAREAFRAKQRETYKEARDVGFDQAVS